MRYDYAKAAAVAMGLVTVVTAGELTAYESSRGPTELIHWDRAKAFNGYTLIRPRGAGVFLIDMAGDVVKYWPELTGAYFMDDGTFVAGDPDESMRLAASEAGDFLYRFGNPANYGQGDFPYYSDKEWFILPYAGHRQIGGNHDIQWIKEGLPGAGNLLLFNNGNSIITLTRPGRLVEKTPDEEVVWEYINPVTAEAGIVTTVVTTEHSNLFGGWAPLRFAPDHPTLIGRDLSPKGPITEFMRAEESPRTDSATELRPEERY